MSDCSNSNSNCSSNSSGSRIKMKTKGYILTILTLMVIGSIASAINNYYKYDVCSTKNCQNVSHSIQKQLNENVNPCDDFYGYVCSNFEKNTKIPEDKTSVTSFTKLNDKLQNQLREVLETKIHDNEIEPFKLMKRIFRSCSDIKKLNEIGLAPLFKSVPEIANWPFENGNFDDFDWKQEMIRFRKIENIYQSIIGFSQSLDFKNSTKKIFSISEPSLSIDREYLVKGLDENHVKALYNFMVNLTLMFDKKSDKSEPVKEVLLFEIELAKLKKEERFLMSVNKKMIISQKKLETNYRQVKGNRNKSFITLPREEKRNFTKFYNMVTIGEIDDKKYKLFEPMGFLNYIKQLLIDENNKDLETILNLSRNQTLNNETPEYLEKIDKLLEVTPKRVLKNYLTWRFLKNSLSFLNEDVRNAILDYSFQVSGLRKRQPRWRECVSLTLSITPYALSSAYVRRFFDEESKNKVEEIVKNIKGEFEKIIENLDWMDEETKMFAKKKLHAMKSIVGYPKQLLNDSAIIEEYKDYTEQWKDDELFLSIQRLRYQDTNSEWKKFREPYDKNDWKNFAGVAVVNAFYSPLTNAIILPAGILQGVFFDKEMPSVMNYGGIGTVIGHEITHGFDDQGSQYDEYGNLRDWWTLKTEMTFREKKNKIVDQYYNYTEPLTGLKLNGNNTQGENIADNGGVIESYRAFQYNDRSNGNLIDLDFKTNQLFWVSYARVWCSAMEKKSLEIRIVTDSHAPSRFRVNGPLQNNKDFANDFQCSSESYMNPQQKNIVWG